MTTALAILGWTLFGLAILAGLALNLAGLFGNWVILGAVAAAWAGTGFERFGPGTLLALAALAALGEVAETAASGYGAARFGGGRGAVAASLAGCVAGAVLGTPLFPVVGTLAGACAGAFGGAALYELLVRGKTAADSARTGAGAALGRIGGLAVKLGLGLVMLAVAAVNF